jgi:hypothetical protein
MYQLKNGYIGQKNIVVELSGKPGMDSGMHWLDPLFVKC